MCESSGVLNRSTNKCFLLSSAREELSKYIRGAFKHLGGGVGDVWNPTVADPLQSLLSRTSLLLYGKI